MTGGPSMRIGMVCPYSLDVPGGVQAQVLGLARALIERGDRVRVLAPAASGAELPPFVTAVGRAVPVPYNGSVARLRMGPRSAARVRRWLAAGVDGRAFDLLHLHEPLAPSVSLLAGRFARGPMVATFHSAYDRSRALAAAESVLQPVLERIVGRIAVSPLARRVQVEHLAGGGVEIPNGLSVAEFAGAAPLSLADGRTVGFLGRFDEPRKGFAVAKEAFVAVARQRPDVRLLVAGPGQAAAALAGLPDDVADRVLVLGAVSDSVKARMLASVDVLIAPNAGGESFGIVLAEAMAAGAAVVASDLESFRRVLAGPGGAELGSARARGAELGGSGLGGAEAGPARPAGVLVPPGDADALARAVGELLDDPIRRAELVANGRRVSAGYDWSSVAERVRQVYELAVAIESGPIGLFAPSDAGDEDMTGTTRSVERAISARAARLARRCTAAWGCLDARLSRRALAAEAFANQVVELCPDAREAALTVVEAARAALSAAGAAAGSVAGSSSTVADGPQEREAVENRLSRQLRALLWAARSGRIDVAGWEDAGSEDTVLEDSVWEDTVLEDAVWELVESRELVAAAESVRLARQVYNDAVRDARALRRTRRGWARRTVFAQLPAVPAFFDMDDAMPPTEWNPANPSYPSSRLATEWSRSESVVEPC